MFTQIGKNKKLAAVFWALSLICMGVIFYFSSRTAAESSSQSTSVIDWLTKLFGSNVFTDFIVRKSAHFLEYPGLCLLLNWALLLSKGKPLPAAALPVASLYAVTDEIHQLFVEGRSCEVKDWAIDTAGAILGICVFYVTLLIVRFIMKRIDTRKNKL